MPSKIETLKTFYLISGIINIAILMGWGVTVPLTGIMTCGFGCILGFIPLINILSCIFDFIAYNKLNKLDNPDTFSSLQTASIFEIVTIITGNIVSLIFGILSNTYINEPEIKQYLKDKNIY